MFYRRSDIEPTTVGFPPVSFFESEKMGGHEFPFESQRFNRHETRLALNISGPSLER